MLSLWFVWRESRWECVHCSCTPECWWVSETLQQRRNCCCLQQNLQSPAKGWQHSAESDSIPLYIFQLSSLVCIFPLRAAEWWGAGVVICLEQGADLHMAQLMPLPLTVSCSVKSRLVLPFWYWLTRVVLDKGPLNGCVWYWLTWIVLDKGPLNGVCVCVTCYYIIWWYTPFTILGPGDLLNILRLL